MWDVIIVVLTLEGGGGGPGHDELHEYSCRRAPYHALPCHSYYIVLYHECSCRAPHSCLPSLTNYEFIHGTVKYGWIGMAKYRTYSRTQNGMEWYDKEFL